MTNFITEENSCRIGLMAKHLGPTMSLLLLLAALPAFSQEDPCPQNKDNAGFKQFTDGGVTREYIIYVPTSYDENNPTPLLINYHGRGDCAADWEATVIDGLIFGDANRGGAFKICGHFLTRVLTSAFF